MCTFVCHFSNLRYFNYIPMYIVLKNTNVTNNFECRKKNWKRTDLI